MDSFGQNSRFLCSLKIIYVLRGCHRLLCVLSLPFLFRCLPAVHCGLGGCVRGQGAGERPHAAGAQVEQRRAHPQVQLPPGVRAQPSPQPHTLV
jgi:hypothetical protein